MFINKSVCIFKKIGVNYLLLMMCLSGCNTVTITVPKSPTIKSKSTIVVQESVLSKEDTQRATRIGESPIYYSQTEGGSIIVGLLGGVLGVLINTALVDHATANKGESSSIGLQLDLYKMVADSIKKSPPDDISSSNLFSLEPFILIQTTKDEKLLTSLVYLVTQKYDGEVIWQEKYFYHFNKKFSKATIIDSNTNHVLFNEHLRNGLSNAINVLSNLVEKDLSGNIPDLREIKFQTNYLGVYPGPYVGIFLSNEDGKTTIRARGNKTDLRAMYIRGMHVLQNSDVVIMAND